MIRLSILPRARDVPPVTDVVRVLQSRRQDEGQRLVAIAADLSSASGTEDAFNAYTDRNANTVAPDYVFSCTGGAGNILGLFVDLSPEQLQQGIRTNYETALWTSHVSVAHPQ